MRSREIQLVRFAWILVVLFGEWAVFGTSVRRCRLKADRSGASEQRRYLVLTDQQLIDETSYPERPSWARTISRWVSDIYLARAFGALDRAFHKDGYLFIGDYMDGGYRLDDKGFERELLRFKSIFAISPPTQTFYAAGNHDVGLKRQGRLDHTYPNARQRFIRSFGPPNSIHSLEGFDLVIIDAVAIAELEQEVAPSEENWLSLIGKEDNYKVDAVDFLAKLRVHGEAPMKPRIVLSHIPFWRPLAHYCGPEREARHGIRQVYGENYQNMLRKGTTETIIRWIKPALVFSGDDHDSCFHRHPPNDIPEHTVKAFSMAMGIKRPGFTVLSLGQPDGLSPTFSTTACTLPDQIRIYTHLYAPLAVITIVLLAFRLFTLRAMTIYLPLHLTKTGMNGGHRLNGSGISATRLQGPNAQNLGRASQLKFGSDRLSNARIVSTAKRIAAYGKVVLQIAWPPVTLFLCLAWLSSPKGSFSG